MSDLPTSKKRKNNDDDNDNLQSNNKQKDISTSNKNNKNKSNKSDNLRTCRQCLLPKPPTEFGTGFGQPREYTGVCLECIDGESEPPALECSNCYQRLADEETTTDQCHGCDMPFCMECFYYEGVTRHKYNYYCDACANRVVQEGNFSSCCGCGPDVLISRGEDTFGVCAGCDNICCDGCCADGDAMAFDGEDYLCSECDDQEQE